MTKQAATPNCTMRDKTGPRSNLLQKQCACSPPAPRRRSATGRRPAIIQCRNSRRRCIGARNLLFKLFGIGSPYRVPKPAKSPSVVGKSEGFSLSSQRPPAVAGACPSCRPRSLAPQLQLFVPLKVLRAPSLARPETVLSSVGQMQRGPLQVGAQRD